MKYRLEPLAAAAGVPVQSLGRLLGVTGSDWQRIRDTGATELAADRYAARLGLHPFVVWPEMADVRIAREQRTCANERCGLAYVPKQRQPRQRYCSPQCKEAAWKRRKYQTSARYRRRVLVYQRQYHALRRRRAEVCACAFGCGAVFVSRRKGHRYCSPECCNAASWLRRRDRRNAERRTRGGPALWNQEAA